MKFLRTVKAVWRFLTRSNKGLAISIIRDNLDVASSFSLLRVVTGVADSKEDVSVRWAISCR